MLLSGYGRSQLSESGAAVVEFPLVPERAALVNVDLQNMFVESTSDGLDIVERVNRLSEACRTAGVLVIHTRHVLRPDGSNMGVLGEINADVRAGVLNEGARTAALHEALISIRLALDEGFQHRFAGLLIRPRGGLICPDNEAAGQTDRVVLYCELL